MRRRRRGIRAGAKALALRDAIALALWVTVNAARHRELLLRRKHELVPSAQGKVCERENVEDGDAHDAGAVVVTPEARRERYERNDGAYRCAPLSYGAPVRPFDVRQFAAQQYERDHLKEVRHHGPCDCHGQQRRVQISAEPVVLQCLVDQEREAEADDRPNDESNVSGVEWYGGHREEVWVVASAREREDVP